MIADLAVVVPWVDEWQRDEFMRAWRLSEIPPWLFMLQDEHRQGCAATKNRGVAMAVEAGAEVVVVLDDDCYPCEPGDSLEWLAELHALALAPQPVQLFEVVTDPPSRGTPYGSLEVEMPVAASMGFWTGSGDYCAVRQLALGIDMTFSRRAIHGRYFPLSGMNLAFRPRDWEPWCRFVDVPRFDDIWMGWMWQREAYRRGYCFNLAGPLVRHARQSNAWRNLQVEARHLETNEDLWRQIATHPDPSYEGLCALLPASPGGSDR